MAELPAGYTLVGSPAPTAAPTLPAGYSLVGQSAPPSDGASSIWSKLKAAGTGIEEGAASLVGLPGDLRKGVNWVADKLLPMSDAQRAAMNQADASSPSKVMLPSSSSLIGGLDDAGLIHKPANSTEQHIAAVSSFLPAAVAGPEGLVKNLVKRGAIPGVASDALGTAGDQISPAAGTAGRIAGAFLAPGVGKAAPGPTTEQVLKNGADNFDNFRSLPFSVKPDAMGAGSLSQKLDNKNFTPRVAPQTNALVDELANRTTPVSAKDMDEYKLLFRNIASSKGNDATAAGVALDHLNDRVNAFTPAQTVTGDPAVAKNIWNTAFNDYSVGKRLETVDDATEKAQLAAAKAGSGRNQDNAYRDKFTSVLNSEKKSRGFTDNELATMDKLVRGGFVGNTVRRAGNMLGGGGGIGLTSIMGAGGALGASQDGTEGGVAGGLAAGIAGLLLRNKANAITAARAQQIADLVRSRSTLAQALQPPRAPALASLGTAARVNMAAQDPMSVFQP